MSRLVDGSRLESVDHQLSLHAVSKTLRQLELGLKRLFSPPLGPGHETGFTPRGGLGCPARVPTVHLFWGGPPRRSEIFPLSQVLQSWEIPSLTPGSPPVK